MVEEKQIECPEVMQIKGTRIKPPFPEGLLLAYFGMGCFWGAEEAFNLNPDIYSVCSGYSNGHVPNPTYYQVKSGSTGHNEVIQIVYDPTRISYSRLLQIFWEHHNPTQLNRQGIDIGSQYRSGIYYKTEEEKREAEQSKTRYQTVLNAAGKGEIVTEILPFTEFYHAEGYHQQYFLKGCEGECGVEGLGVPFPSQ